MSLFMVPWAILSSNGTKARNIFDTPSICSAFEYCTFEHVYSFVFEKERQYAQRQRELEFDLRKTGMGSKRKGWQPADRLRRHK